jgi:hypothetical protein
MRETKTAVHVYFQVLLLLQDFEFPHPLARPCLSIGCFTWTNDDTVKEWWMSFIFLNGTRRKYASLAMVASWEISNECNARVFRNVVTMLFIVVSRIMGEALELGRGQAFELKIMPRE